MNGPEDRSREVHLEGTPKGDHSTEEDTQGVTIEGDTGVPWVTLRDAEHATGVAVSTLRKWRKRGALESRMEPGPTGERIVVPLEAVRRIAAERGLGTGPAPTPAVEAPEPPAAVPSPELEPPKWAMELLSRADARTESLLDRLRQAEEERADAQRDARVAEHKLETARTEAEELKAERDRLRRQLDGTPEPPEPEPESIEEEPEPEPEPPSAGWWTRRPGHVVAAAKRLPWWKRPYIRSRRGS